MAARETGVKVYGAEEFRKAMRRMAADLSDLKAVNLNAAEKVASEARQIVPHISGNLEGSIKAGASQKRGYVTAGNNRKKRKGKSTASSGAVPYAGPIHFGWPARNISPQPFLYDALDVRRDEVVGAYEAHIEALVEKVGRETPP